MLLKLLPALPEGADWLYEIKFDGYRAIAIKDGERLELRSRGDKSLTADYPAIVEALRALKPCRFILDGEIVAFDAAGKPSFQALQRPSRASDVQFYAFDLLHLDGQDLLTLPLSERKRLLATLLKRDRHPLRLSLSLEASPADLVAAAYAQGFEGIVAKRRDSA